MAQDRLMTDPDLRLWPLCYETNNYSPSLTGYFAEPVQSMPSLTDQLSAASAHGFAFVGLDMGSVSSYLEEGRSPTDLRQQLDALGLRCLGVAALSLTAGAHTPCTCSRRRARSSYTTTQTCEVHSAIRVE